MRQKSREDHLSGTQMLNRLVREDSGTKWTGNSGTEAEQTGNSGTERLGGFL